MTESKIRQSCDRGSPSQKSLLGTLAVILGGDAVIGLMTLLKSKPEPEALAVPLSAKVETVTVVPEARRVRVSSQGTVSPLHQSS